MSARRFDVAVVGGGSAGVAAAIAAAERGARCLLVERENALGGNISQAFVHTICGLYLADETAPRFANPGFPQRFTRSLQAHGAAREALRVGRVWVLPTDPPRLAAAALEHCRATPGLEIALGAELVGAALSEAAGGEQQLQLRDAQGGVSELRARIVVDASGDAALAAIAGAEVEVSETPQLPSFIFRLADVDTEALDALQGFGRLRVTRAVAGAVRDGALPAGCESVLVRPGFDAGRVYVTLNVPRPSRGWDPLDPDAVAVLRDEARGSAERLAEFLRETRPAFAHSRVEAWPARLGLREGRRACGLGRVTREDVCSGRRDADEVALSTWPIELWRDHRRAAFVHADGPSGVPLAALLSRSAPGLAVAGRCLAADADALGALRVIGTALATGEAAGVAAACAADARSGLADVAAAEVRAHILERATVDDEYEPAPTEADG